MSIADHFYDAPDEGFLRKWNATSARRQFRVSVVLILALAVAGIAIGRVTVKTAVDADLVSIAYPAPVDSHAPVYGRLIR